ncbi:FIG014328: hypothetical protein [hydrothermal vent metagenome]|uniref:DUF2333 domain-containing protein n=1 Tax=hydrothermal vent metagenome TaxID=652676 RepID=A0A3B0X2P8_9ZZZZ
MKLLDLSKNTYNKFRERLTPQGEHDGTLRGRLIQIIPIVLVIIILTQLILAYLWSIEPERFDINQRSATLAETRNETITTGYTTISTLIITAETLLDKPGGYLSNDVMPPTSLADDIPNWEFGVLTQIRDLTLALRNDFTRSQSQSVEDKDVIAADNLFRIDSESWLLPSAEGEYRKGLNALYRYLARLTDQGAHNAQFYARADNLNVWLGLISKRLGSLSQRLSASVSKTHLNIDLAGDANAEQSTPTHKEVNVKTPWLKIDNVFFEARGSAWALRHLLLAAQVDFKSILENKNAQVSLQQIIHELESTQDTVYSLAILNGNGFGLFANHSLVMANYISRANAAVIDLRQLLKQG